MIRDGIQTSSPVITAEQLYTTTGWIENSTPTVSHRVKNLIKLSKANENLDSSSPLTTSLIFESDGEDDEEEVKAKEIVSLIEASLPKQILPLQTFFAEQKQKANSSGKENSSSVSNVTCPPKEIVLVSIVEPKIETKSLPHSKSEPKQHQEEQEEEETDEVPQSMAEIFKLSNQIKRKRNKEKRKLREESKQFDDEG